MTSVIHATVLDGVLKPDVPLPLPNGSRVRVHVEPIAPAPVEAKSPYQEFVEYSKQHPVFSDGERFNREDLYDRG